MVRLPASFRDWALSRDKAVPVDCQRIQTHYAWQLWEIIARAANGQNCLVWLGNHPNSHLLEDGWEGLQALLVLTALEILESEIKEVSHV